MSKTKDKIVLITGAARGIGKGIADCFVAEGAKVIVTDLSQELIDVIDSDHISGMVGDAANQDEMKHLIAQVVAEYGQLDVLVNNAGIGGPTTDFHEMATDSAVSNMTDASWDEQLVANLRTTLANHDITSLWCSKSGRRSFDDYFSDRTRSTSD